MDEVSNARLVELIKSSPALWHAAQLTSHTGREDPVMRLWKSGRDFRRERWSITFLGFLTSNDVGDARWMTSRISIICVKHNFKGNTLFYYVVIKILEMQQCIEHVLFEHYKFNCLIVNHSNFYLFICFRMYI